MRLNAATRALFVMVSIDYSYSQPGGNIDLGDLLGMLGGAGGGGGGGKGKAAICPKGEVAVPGDDQFTDAHLFANGCGPTGMQMSEPYGLYKCCNGHDICYGLCGTTHSFCEKQFKKCMKKVCEEQLPEIQANCTQQAGGFSGMTAGFG
jgi:secretory phospholipase A2